MKKSAWYLFLFVFLIAAVFITMVVTISIGSTEMTLKEVYTILYDHLFQGGRLRQEGAYPVTHFKIIWQIRLPRTIFALLVGMGLSICGGAMQALVLNPIADPYILGVSSGASAGAAFALLVPIAFLEGQRQTTAFAFGGALASVFIVLPKRQAAVNCSRLHCCCPVRR